MLRSKNESELARQKHGRGRVGVKSGECEPFISVQHGMAGSWETIELTLVS